MFDWRGVEVKVGDSIIYCTRHGSWMGMAEAVVESIDSDKATVRIVRRDGSGVKERVVLTDRYLTVVTLPESTKSTLVEENIEREKRRAIARAERDAREAACGEHVWTNHFSYRMCKNCRRCEYGSFYPEGYKRQW